VATCEVIAGVPVEALQQHHVVVFACIGFEGMGGGGWRSCKSMATCAVLGVGVTTSFSVPVGVEQVAGKRICQHVQPSCRKMKVAQTASSVPLRP
jgi:hypothetical protein